MKELSANYQCTPRTIYYDFETRPKWQPIILEMKRALLKIVNRHDQLYRKASLNYMQAPDPKAKLYAINLMRVINRDFFDMLQSTGNVDKVSEDTIIKLMEDEYAGIIRTATIQTTYGTKPIPQEQSKE